MNFLGATYPLSPPPPFESNQTNFVFFYPSFHATFKPIKRFLVPSIALMTKRISMSSLIVSGKECEHIKSSVHVRTFNDFFSDETFTFGWLETGDVCTVVICIEPDGYGFTYIDWYLTILLVFSDWCGMLLGDDQSLMGFIFPCLHKQVRRTSLPNCEFIDSGSCPISPGNMFTVNLIFRLKHRSQSPMCSGNFFFFFWRGSEFWTCLKTCFWSWNHIMLSGIIVAISHTVQ